MRIISIKLPDVFNGVPQRSHDENVASIIPRSAVSARPDTEMRVPGWLRTLGARVTGQLREEIILNPEQEKLVNNLAVSEAKARGRNYF